MTRRDIRDTVLVLLVLAIGFGGIWMTATYGASSVNPNVPATGAASASTPIRGNFSTIKTEIEALQAQHPASTDNQLVRFSGTAGTLQNGSCNEADDGSLACEVTSANPAFKTTQSGAGYVAQLIGTGLWYLAKTGAITQTANSTASALSVTQQNATGDALSVATGSGSAGDMTLALNETSGQCLTTTATGDDPKTCVTHGRVQTTDATATVAQTIATTTDTSYLVETRVIGRRVSGTGSSGDSAYYVMTYGIVNVGGTAVIAGGAIIENQQYEDVAGWSAGVDYTGANVRVKVTGAASTTVTWHVESRILGPLGS